MPNFNDALRKIFSTKFLVFWYVRPILIPRFKGKIYGWISNQRFEYNV
jgi:hypothetical protein